MTIETRTKRWCGVVVLTGMVALLGAACGEDDGPTVPSQAVRIPAQDIDTLLAETASGAEERARLVLRSASVWDAFWAEVHANRSPAPEPPAVDFERSTVIAAAMGSRPSGGYSIGIEEVHRTDDALWVVVRETSPGDSCVTTGVVTDPVTAVRVPWTGGEVRFVERETVREC
ncbi:MAG: protease complex subunit PrcB family protein [Gemmatimonadota bacterium]